MGKKNKAGVPKFHLINLNIRVLGKWRNLSCSVRFGSTKLSSRRKLGMLVSSFVFQFICWYFELKLNFYYITFGLCFFDFSKLC